MQNEPRYSPDGKRIAFDSLRSGQWSVWMADADGTNPVQLSRGGAAGYPSWSPDSQKIAFHVENSSGLWELYVIDIHEQTAHRLKTNVEEASNPVWSRDGKWIYFRGYQNKSRQIYRCPAEGGEAELILEMADLTDTEVESLDGTALYFANDDGALFKVSPIRANATATVMPGVANIAWNVPWTIDANGIYFVPQDNLRSLRFYDFETKKTRELFRAERNFGEGITISPDGRYLLFSRIDANNSDIMVARGFR